MSQLWKSGWARAGAVVALLVALYALAGFFVAPKLVRSNLIEGVETNLGVTPTVGEIRFNPFKLTLEVKDFALPAAGGGKLLGFGRLFIDVAAASLWRRAVVFEDIDLDEPFVNAVVAADGSINLAKLKPKAAAPPPKPEEPAKPLPRIQIATFNVIRGLVTYEDMSRPTHFAARLEPIEFDLRDFSTGVDGGRFEFVGVTKRGERIEWRGHVAVQPLESDGEIKVIGLQARTLWEYLEDKLAFVVESGRIDVGAHYRFSLKDAVDLHLDVNKATVGDLAVRPKGGDTDWIVVPEFAVQEAAVDLARRDVKVDSAVFTGLKLVTWLERDRTLNLMSLAGDLLEPSPPQDPPPPPWTLSVREFAVKEANVSAEDRGTKPAAKFVLAPLSLQVEGASLDLSRPLQVKFETGINGAGHAVLAGAVTPQPLAADLGIQLQNFDLKALEPYVDVYTAMTVLDGRAGADLKLRLGGGKPALALAGNVDIESLHTVDHQLKADFINWQRVDVLGLKYTQGPDRLEIDRIVARKPYARIIIESDSSLNVTRVLAGPAGSQPLPASAAAAVDAAANGTTAAPGAAAVSASAASAAPAPSIAISAPIATTSPTASAAPAVRATSTAIKHRKAPRRPAAGVAGSPAAAAPGKAAMYLAIRKVEVSGGEVDFSDLSIQPNFSAGIQKLEGTIAGLSSQPESRAKVDLHGQVDAFSPVTIAGEVNLLSPALYTDIAMSFRNIDLSIFNPYSGKFAGYNISKGKLTTELRYKVEGRKLDAKHHINIDQLEFGAKTASKDAVSLPVKLAVALLKDRHGVIDLDLPVSGSLDDPKFRIWPIVGKVLLNILEKIVTAPFALLGSLFAGGPDLQFVDFQPGLADLQPAAVDKVKSLAKALQERPQLKIELPIAALPEVDRPALIDARYRAQIQDAQKGRAGAAPTPFEQLDPAAQRSLLQTLYAKTVGAEPKYPDAIQAIKAKPDADAARRDYLAQALRARITVSDDDLEALAQKRAVAMQQALLTDTQLDPERVFLVVNDKAKAKDGAVRLELSLQ